MAAVTSLLPRRGLFHMAASTFLRAAGPLVSQERPQEFGYSQSRSMPSKTVFQRGSFTRFQQEVAKADGFAAACVKPPDQVQPPNDQKMRRPGCRAFNSAN